MKNFILIIFLSFTSIICGQSSIMELGELPQQIKETSGLLFYNNKLITHNDSGNAPELYEINLETFTIERIVTITNASNKDWEDITQDEDYIYVGDFGNNNGDRVDLGILKIAKTEYNTSNEVNAELISFSYEDQTDFTSTRTNDYDAEAMFSRGDSLVVLTKQWKQMGTVAYTIPKMPGNFSAKIKDSYQIDGLVTGAAYDEINNELFLVGYSQFLAPFFVSNLKVTEDSIFGDAVKKVALDIGAAQVEGVSISSTNEIYFSSEEYINLPVLDTKSRLFSFSIDANEDSEEETPDDEESGDEGEEEIPEEQLIVFKEYGSPYLNYKLNTKKEIIAMGVFNATGTLITYVPLERMTNEPLDIAGYSSAIYYLSFFYLDNKILSAPFLKD